MRSSLIGMLWRGFCGVGSGDNFEVEVTSSPEIAL